MSGNQEPDVTQSPETVNVQGCPPIGGGDPSCDEAPIILDPDYPDFQDAVMLVSTANTAMNALMAERANVIAYLDSGMTDTLLAHLGNASYSNATLTSELLQYSFLSDTVLNAACVRTPFFTEPQFQSIMVHNSPVSRRVWPFLADALATKVKQEYADTILSAQWADTLRTVGSIEREMDLVEVERFTGISTALNYYAKFDTIPDSTYALIHYVLDSLEGTQWQKLAVGLAYGVDTVSWARSILDSIPLETADDSLFYDYHDLALSLKEDTLTWFDMDGAQQALVNSIASGNSSLKFQAQAVQMLLGDSNVVRIPEQLPEEISGKWGSDEETTSPEPIMAYGDVKVYPNPFSNEFTVSYTLPDTVSQLKLEVFDLTGRLVLSETVMSTYTGTRVLNVGDCKGLYVLRLNADGYMIRSEKLICIHDR